MEAEINSLCTPIPGQKSRSSRNFSLFHLPTNKKVRVVVERKYQGISFTFDVMSDELNSTDHVIWNNVGNGSILKMPDLIRQSKGLYIANPSISSTVGFTDLVRETFKVKFYTLE